MRNNDRELRLSDLHIPCPKMEGREGERNITTSKTADCFPHIRLDLPITPILWVFRSLPKSAGRPLATTLGDSSGQKAHEVFSSHRL